MRRFYVVRVKNRGSKVEQVEKALEQFFSRATLLEDFSLHKGLYVALEYKRHHEPAPFEDIFQAISLIYKDLRDESLFKRRIDSYRQNANNIWYKKTTLKTSFSERGTVEILVYLVTYLCCLLIQRAFDLFMNI